MSGADVSRVEPSLKHGGCVANSTISIDGFLKDASTDPTGMAPFFMIEVDSIEETAARAERFGGRVLRGRYEANGQQYAVLADSEGNAFYIWETPATVTWDEPESQGG